MSREELALALATDSNRARFQNERNLAEDDVERAVRAGAVRAVDAAETADAIDPRTAVLLRGLALTLPLESVISELSDAFDWEGRS